MKCLINISSEKNHFAGKVVGSVSTFFPLNLPLYSTVLFAVVPSFFTEKLYLRPPLLMRGVIEQVFQILEISSLFPKIQKLELERNDFVSNYVLSSDVVIFTGTYENASNLRKKLPSQVLFLYNGAGNNPLIITESADIKLAVAKTIDIKVFNSGQDCAGPDSIFVQTKISKKFIKKLTDKLRGVKVGDYQNSGVRIGKLIDPKHLLFVSKVLNEYKDGIVYGGIVDFTKGIVQPTVIVTEITKKINYTEFFAPIFYITLYDNDSDLSFYFENSNYLDHAMYVSVFGDSEYSQKIKKSIILKNKIILDIEDGNKEFGGYGSRSSFVAIENKIVARPILISKEIRNYNKNGE